MCGKRWERVRPSVVVARAVSQTNVEVFRTALHCHHAIARLPFGNKWQQASIVTQSSRGKKSGFSCHRHQLNRRSAIKIGRDDKTFVTFESG